MVDQDKRKIKKFYDNLANKYWSRVPQRYGPGAITTHYDLREKSIVQRLVTVKPHTLTLDLCSGPGRWILEYGKRGAQIIALDISAEVLRSSKEKLKYAPNLQGNAQFIVADAENLPFVSDTFDIVNCFDAFPHFPNQEQSLIEMKRVTKPDATIIVEPSNTYSLIGIGIHIIRFLSRLLRRINIKTPIWTTTWNKYDSPSRSKHLIHSAGLRVVYMRGVGILPLFSRVCVYALYKIEETMERNPWFNLLGSRIVFICSPYKSKKSSEERD